MGDTMVRIENEVKEQDVRCLRCGRLFTYPNTENEVNFCCICLRDMQMENKYGSNWRKVVLELANKGEII